MKRGAVSRSLALASATVLLVLFGCSEGPPPTAPTAADYERERAAAAARARKSQKSPKVVAKAKTERAQPAEESAAGNTFTAVAAGYRYDANDKRDPFKPFRIAPAKRETEVGGPLQNFELEQLEVVAVVWAAKKPRAMVADPAGGTYVIGVDSKMGKNNGRVIHIGDNLVLVKETYVDFAGERTTKDVELRIRGNQGG